MRNGIVTIDCHYGGPEFASAYLIVENGRAAYVDTNTVHAVPYLLEALQHAGLAPGAVEYVIVTHIHLDHAGGAAPLMRACKNAMLLCHPRAARHLANPRRLVAAVKQVYGEEVFERLYGTIEPIEETRIRAVNDGDAIAFGKRRWTFLHTLGHATHHICMHDSAADGIFTGDSFGLFYRRLTPDPARPFIMCLSTPTEFDAEEARNAVHRLVSVGAKRAYVGHFGELPNMADAAPVLLNTIDRFEAIQHDAVATNLAGDELLEFCRQQVESVALELCAACGNELEPQQRVRLAGDVLINARGIAHNAQRMRLSRAAANTPEARA